MEDRQFLRLLAIVVATGLVLGLVTFHVSRRDDSAVTGGRGPVAAPSGASAPRADGGSSPVDGDAVATRDGGIVVNTMTGEPTTPATDPPPMQGPGNTDPPGTAATGAPPPSDVSQ